MRRRSPFVSRSLLALSVTACGTTSAPVAPLDDGDTGEASIGLALCGARIAGGDAVDLEIDGANVSAVLPSGESTRCSGPDGVDLRGKWLAPAFIDSHVHLAYFDASDGLARGGVAAAVDLAAPIDFLERSFDSLRVIAAGPMITAPAGYPTQSWGAGGYGWEVEDADEAVGAVEELRDRGARLIKIPLNGEPMLSDEVITAVIDRAHELEMKVAVHALDDAQALRGAALGADLLAHVPTEELSEATLEAWRGRALVPTLAAFGARPAAIDNVSALREHGVTVLYGTDLGNSRELGIQPSEIAAMMSAGFDGRAVLEAGTAAPAAYWGLDDLGELETGKTASLVVLDADPLLEPMTLGEPAAAMLDGRWMAPPVPQSPDVGG